LRGFTMNPRLPEGWNFMKLKNLRAFQSEFDIEVSRKGKNARVVVIQSGKIIFNKKWDQKSKLTITLN